MSFSTDSATRRLLVISYNIVPAPDRHGVQVSNIFRALAPHWQVDAIAIRAENQAFVERFMRTRVCRVPIGSGKGLLKQVESFRRAVRRQLEGSDYELIHFRSAWAGRPVCEQKEELGAKLVFELALSPEGEPRAADPAVDEALRRDEAYCLEKADLILVPTELARTELTRRGIESGVALFPPGVDVDLFDWEPSKSTGIPRVMYAGRIGPGRGLRLLAKAMRRVVDKRQAALSLLGPVEAGFEEHLKREMAPLEGHYELLGAVHHEDVPHMLARARVAVAPSSPDEKRRPFAAIPSKILEYLACKCPIVAPRRPIVTELVRDGEEALLFTPNDDADLAAKILRLLEEPDTADRLAQTGYRSVRERYTAAASRRALLRAFEQVVGPLPERDPAELSLPVSGFPTDHETTTGRRPSMIEEPGTMRVAVVPPPLEDLPRSRSMSGELTVTPVPANEPKGKDEG